LILERFVVLFYSILKNNKKKNRKTSNNKTASESPNKSPTFG
jgi:hypothetical protein